jgi:hypothetical protein
MFILVDEVLSCLSGLCFRSLLILIIL